MAVKLEYPKHSEGSTGSFSVYASLGYIPLGLRKSGVKVSYTITATGDGSSGWQTTVNGTSYMKVVRSTGTSTTKLGTYSKTGSAGNGVSYQGTNEITVDLSKATKIGFKLSCSGRNTKTDSGGGTAQVSAYTSHAIQVTFTAPSGYSAETFITASFAKELASTISVVDSAEAGSNIKKNMYNAMADKVGASWFDATFPTRSSLTALLTKVNSATISRLWSSYEESYYNNL